MDKVTDISVRIWSTNYRKRKRKYVSSDSQPQTEKYVRKKGCSYFRIGTWKDNVSSVNLDWRRRSTGRLSKGDRPAGHSSRPVSYSCVFSGHRTTSQKDPRHRRKKCAMSRLLYSYSTQSSPSKNKNINYILIYLRVFRCLSSSPICNTYNCQNRT